MNSHLRVSVLCFWLFFLAFRPILCCCVHIFDATVTPPSFAREAYHLRSPSRHTTLVRLRRHLRRISRRDKPSRYGSFEQLHFGHTTLRPSGTIGLWARPTPSHHLGSSIGQAFQSHLFTFGHGWALGSTHPFPPPRKQYRTSFPRTSGGCIGQACHPTSFRLRQHLRRISRRDKPSRYGSFEQLHLGHPTSVEDSGPPPPSVRLRQHLRRISRRDKPSRYGSFEKLHFGHTTRRPSGMIGLWARPIPSTTSEAV
jgi:hypothetical protein